MKIKLKFAMTAKKYKLLHKYYDQFTQTVVFLHNLQHTVIHISVLPGHSV